MPPAGQLEKISKANRNTHTKVKKKAKQLCSKNEKLLATVG